MPGFQPPKGDNTPDTEVPLLKAILGFPIPSYCVIDFTYYGSTNNIKTQTFRASDTTGEVVGMLTFSYVGGGASNNDNISRIQFTQPQP